MNIQIDGTNTSNKGAELMLYAMLEQIEKKGVNNTVYYNPNNTLNKIPIDTSLKLKRRIGLILARYPIALLSRLKIPFNFFTSKYPVDFVNVILDGGGFQFSDQWKYSDTYLNTLEAYYKKLNSNGTKIIFLPQALGPFDTKSGKRTAEILNKYADLIIAREETSYNYILKANVKADKVKLFPDFTLPVKGQIPEKFLKLKGYVCIIPNKKMITHTEGSTSAYVDFLKDIIARVEKKGFNVFLLNHEGDGDLEICKVLNKKFNNAFEIVTGLNAKEVKGVIGNSYIVISSRFHGVASSLSQGVPCLSTSWNHKYEMLFKDFGQADRVINVSDNRDEVYFKLDEILDRSKNGMIKNDLLFNKKALVKKVNFMWEYIWNFILK